METWNSFMEAIEGHMTNLGQGHKTQTEKKSCLPSFSTSVLGQGQSTHAIHTFS
jgi:hypothetical protein